MGRKPPAGRWTDAKEDERQPEDVFSSFLEDVRAGALNGEPRIWDRDLDRRQTVLRRNAWSRKDEEARMDPNDLATLRVQHGRSYRKISAQQAKAPVRRQASRRTAVVLPRSMSVPNKLLTAAESLRMLGDSLVPKNGDAHRALRAANVISVPMGWRTVTGDHEREQSGTAPSPVSCPVSPETDPQLPPEPSSSSSSSSASDSDSLDFSPGLQSSVPAPPSPASLAASSRSPVFTQQPHPVSFRATLDQVFEVAEKRKLEKLYKQHDREETREEKMAGPEKDEKRYKLDAILAFLQFAFDIFGNVDECFDALDLNHNGYLSCAEFLTALSTRGFHGDALLVFRVLDTDKGGFIAKEELHTLIPYCQKLHLKLERALARAQAEASEDSTPSVSSRGADPAPSSSLPPVVVPYTMTLWIFRNSDPTHRGVKVFVNRRPKSLEEIYRMCDREARPITGKTLALYDHHYRRVRDVMDLMSMGKYVAAGPERLTKDTLWAFQEFDPITGRGMPKAWGSRQPSRESGWATESQASWRKTAGTSVSCASSTPFSLGPPQCALRGPCGGDPGWFVLRESLRVRRFTPVLGAQREYPATR